MKYGQHNSVHHSTLSNCLEEPRAQENYIGPFSYKVDILYSQHCRSLGLASICNDQRSLHRVRIVRRLAKYCAQGITINASFYGLYFNALFMRSDGRAGAGRLHLISTTLFERRNSYTACDTWYPAFTAPIRLCKWKRAIFMRGCVKMVTSFNFWKLLLWECMLYKIHSIGTCNNQVKILVIHSKLIGKV